MSRSRTLAVVGAAALLVVSVAPAAAQEDTDSAMDTEGVTVEVTGVEYAFLGLPTSLPAGSELGFTNDGAEVHELALLRMADDTTETLEEILAMEAEGLDPIGEGLVEFVAGNNPLFAAPGTAAEGTLALEREGRYVALCFIPQGVTDMSALEFLGPDADPAEAPPEIQELAANPPHVALGMIQEFAVTAAGTEVGPLPEAGADEMSEAEEEVADEVSEAEEEVAEAREEIEEEKEEAKEQASD